jgi:hypothetical protein
LKIADGEIAPADQRLPPDYLREGVFRFARMPDFSSQHCRCRGFPIGILGKSGPTARNLTFSGRYWRNLYRPRRRLVIMEMPGKSFYPGDDATPAGIRALADAYRDAALML